MSCSTVRILPSLLMGGTLRSALNLFFTVSITYRSHFVSKRMRNSTFSMVSNSLSGRPVGLVLFSLTTVVSFSFQCFATSSVSFVLNSLGCSRPMKTSGSIDRSHTLWPSGPWFTPPPTTSTSSMLSELVRFLLLFPLSPFTLFVEVRTELALQIHYTQPGGITGHFMLFILVLMYSTAHHKIRAQCFEAFWYTHHLAFFFMIGLYTHATGCFVRDSVDPDYISTFPFYSTQHCLGYESWRFIIWPGIIYFGERIYREIRARRATRLSKLLVHPSGTSGCTLFCLYD
jgi:hypothetical protein